MRVFYLPITALLILLALVAAVDGDDAGVLPIFDKVYEVLHDAGIMRQSMLYFQQAAVSQVEKLEQRPSNEVGASEDSNTAVLLRSYKQLLLSVKEELQRFNECSNLITAIFNDFQQLVSAPTEAIKITLSENLLQAKLLLLKLSSRHTVLSQFSQIYKQAVNTFGSPNAIHAILESYIKYYDFFTSSPSNTTHEKAIIEKLEHNILKHKRQLYVSSYVYSVYKDQITQFLNSVFKHYARSPLTKIDEMVVTEDIRKLRVGMADREQQLRSVLDTLQKEIDIVDKQYADYYLARESYIATYLEYQKRLIAQIAPYANVVDSFNMQDYNKLLVDLQKYCQKLDQAVVGFYDRINFYLKDVDVNRIFKPYYDKTAIKFIGNVNEQYVKNIHSALTNIRTLERALREIQDRDNASIVIAKHFETLLDRSITSAQLTNIILEATENEESLQKLGSAAQIYGTYIKQYPVSQPHLFILLGNSRNVFDMILNLKRLQNVAISVGSAISSINFNSMRNLRQKFVGITRYRVYLNELPMQMYNLRMAKMMIDGLSVEDKALYFSRLTPRLYQISLVLEKQLMGLASWLLAHAVNMSIHQQNLITTAFSGQKDLRTIAAFKNEFAKYLLGKIQRFEYVLNENETNLVKVYRQALTLLRQGSNIFEELQQVSTAVGVELASDADKAVNAKSIVGYRVAENTFITLLGLLEFHIRMHAYNITGLQDSPMLETTKVVMSLLVPLYYMHLAILHTQTQTLRNGTNKDSINELIAKVTASIAAHRSRQGLLIALLADVFKTDTFVMNLSRTQLPPSNPALPNAPVSTLPNAPVPALPNAPVARLSSPPAPAASRVVIELLDDEEVVESGNIGTPSTLKEKDSSGSFTGESGGSGVDVRDKVRTVIPSKDSVRSAKAVPEKDIIPIPSDESTIRAATPANIQRWTTSMEAVKASITQTMTGQSLAAAQSPVPLQSRVPIHTPLTVQSPPPVQSRAPVHSPLTVQQSPLSPASTPQSTYTSFSSQANEENTVSAGPPEARVLPPKVTQRSLTQRSTTQRSIARKPIAVPKPANRAVSGLSGDRRSATGLQPGSAQQAVSRDEADAMDMLCNLSSIDADPTVGTLSESRAKKQRTLTDEGDK